MDNYYLHQSRYHGLTPTNFTFKYESVYGTYWADMESKPAREARTEKDTGHFENKCLTDKVNQRHPMSSSSPGDEVLENDGNIRKSSAKKENHFYCQPCDKTLACSRSFRRHVKLVHKNTQVFQCKVCQEEFTTGPGYFKHKRTCGVKERTIPCTIPGCAVMFASGLVTNASF